MKSISQMLAILVGLSLLGALAVGGIAAIEYVTSLYMSLDPQLARVTAIVLFIALMAAWTITHSIRKATAQRMRQQLSEEITAAYQYFMDYWIETINQGRLSDANPEAGQILDRIMALYGGAEAIRAHVALKTMMQEKVQISEMRNQFGKALLAFRRDLGAAPQGITARELQQLVFPEPNLDEYSTELPQPNLDSEQKLSS